MMYALRPGERPLPLPTMAEVAGRVIARRIAAPDAAAAVADVYEACRVARIACVELDCGAVADRYLIDEDWDADERRLAVGLVRHLWQAAQREGAEAVTAAPSGAELIRAAWVAQREHEAALVAVGRLRPSAPWTDDIYPAGHRAGD